MSLAKGLNDLAAAHAQNLLSDDDYRLLRQELFDRYSAEPQQQTPKPPRPAQVQALQSQVSSPSLRRKASVVSGVANLFRRATGRPAKKQSETLPPIQDPLPSRRILRKPSLLSIIRPDQAPQQSPSSQPSLEDDPVALRKQISSTEAEYTRLLEAFTSLEASTLKRIQYKTARRLYTPTPTNVSVLVSGREWRKHTKPVPSIVLPPLSHHASQPLSTHHQHRIHHLSTSSSTQTHGSDQLSIHSAGSSSKLSLARSFSSLVPTRNSTTTAAIVQQQPPLSPLSPHFRPPTTHMLQRHDSVSSASTQSTHASSRLALGSAPRSMGNLYLTSLPERSGSSVGRNVVEEEDEDDDDDLENDDPEAADYESALRQLDDIRRRREELDTRFAGILEYLKARLKAAELHERVMRR